MFRTLVLSLIALSLFGCAQQRTLPRVKEVADRSYRDHNWEAARVDYQEYIDRKPGEAEINIKLARCLVELGRAPEAVNPAAAAYDSQPNNPDAIETFSLALCESKRTDQLYRLLNGNCESRGSVSDYDRLGRYSLKLGDPDGAERAFKMAAKVDAGKTIEPQLALADFYHNISDKSNEKRRLRMALYLDPSNPDLYKRLKDLGEIPGPSLQLRPEEMTAEASVKSNN
jgi:tetratricopeptide (TPR) repeat protein